MVAHGREDGDGNNDRNGDAELWVCLYFRQKILDSGRFPDTSYDFCKRLNDRIRPSGGMPLWGRVLGYYALVSADEKFSLHFRCGVIRLDVNARVATKKAHSLSVRRRVPPKYSGDLMRGEPANAVLESLKQILKAAVVETRCICPSQRRTARRRIRFDQLDDLRAFHQSQNDAKVVTFEVFDALAHDRDSRRL